jgi:hypothetical protein
MKKSTIIIVLLAMIEFWRSVYLPESIAKLSNYALYLLFFYSFINLIYEKKLRFKNAIIVLLIGIVLNAVSALVNNGQGMKDTLLSIGYFYMILVYFFLHEQKPDRKFLENTIIVFAVLYSLFYLMQASAFPRRLFYGNIFYDRGTLRAYFSGSGFLILGYFLLLNRFFLERKPWYILGSMFFLLILIKSGFRTYSAAAVLLSAIIYVKMVKYSPANYLMIVVVVILFMGLLQLESTSTIINNMFKVSEEQKAMGERYIRVMARDYFMHAYPQNWSYYVFGGGFPGATGGYSKKMLFMVTEYGFYYSDIGLIGFYFVIGGVTLLGLLLYTIKSIFIKLTPDALYLNIFFVYLILVSYTTNFSYCYGIFGVIGLALYLIDVSRNELMAPKEPPG